MIRALCSFNFHNSFITLVSIVVLLTVILHNCFAMQLFDVGRCVGQGDSLSVYLFIIALEVLLVIMSDEEIKGIAVENEVLRMAAIADDLTNFLHISRCQVIVKLNYPILL